MKKEKQVVKHTSTTNLYHHYNMGQRERDYLMRHNKTDIRYPKVC